MNSPIGNNLKEWIGRSETVSDVVTPVQVNVLSSQAPSEMADEKLGVPVVRPTPVPPPAVLGFERIRHCVPSNWALSESFAAASSVLVEAPSMFLPLPEIVHSEDPRFLNH